MTDPIPYTDLLGTPYKRGGKDCLWLALVLLGRFGVPLPAQEGEGTAAEQALAEWLETGPWVEVRGGLPKAQVGDVVHTQEAEDPAGLGVVVDRAQCLVATSIPGYGVRALRFRHYAQKAPKVYRWRAA